MANATYKGTQVSRAIHATSASGNSWSDDSNVTPTAALATTDQCVVMTIPAGVRLHRLRYRNGDFDTGTSLAVNLGYRSKHATPQLAANLTYFLSAATTLQAAQASWVEIVFPEITFPEPVDIVLTPSTGAAGVSGTPTIYFQASGNVVGYV
jgi:hypothetical protein